MSDVEIEVTERSRKVVVDGRDLSGAVYSLDFHAEPGRDPRLELRLNIRDVSRLGAANVEVHLDPTCASYLESAGWTPPPGVGSVLDRDADGCPCERKDVSRYDAEPETILGRIVPTCPMHGVNRKAAA